MTYVANAILMAVFAYNGLHLVDIIERKGQVDVFYLVLTLAAAGGYVAVHRSRRRKADQAALFDFVS